MAKTIRIRVTPYSEKESELMTALWTHQINGVECLIGSTFGLNFNEYRMTEDQYKAIKHEL